MGVPRLDIDAMTGGLHGRGGQQPDGPGAQHKHTLTVTHLSAPHGTPGDSRWLDQKRVTDVEAVRQGQQGVLRHQRALGHAAVAEHTEVAVSRLGAALRIAELALYALATVDGGF